MIRHEHSYGNEPFAGLTRGRFRARGQHAQDFPDREPRHPDAARECANQAVGTLYSWAFTLPFDLCFRFDEIVTEWVETERLAYRALSGWDMEALAAFQPDGAGTKETFTLKYRAPADWSWLMPARLVRLASGRRWQTSRAA